MEFNKCVFLLQIVEKKVVHVDNVLCSEIVFGRATFLDRCHLQFVLEELDRAERRRIVVLAEELKCTFVERRTTEVDFDQILTTFEFDGIFDEFVVQIAVRRMLLNGILTGTVGHIFQGSSERQARDRYLSFIP